MFWLLLFGNLFESVVRIPGFETSGSYMEYLTPGVIAMTALFSAMWAGTVYVDDMQRGVMDRLLASPVSRGAMMNGTLAYQSLTSVAQTVIVLVVAFLAGARFSGGFTGIAVTVVAAILLTVVCAALSNEIALMARQPEALIGISQFLSLPATFLSSAVMDPALAPGLMQTAATYNPLDWAVVASREALLGSPDLGHGLAPARRSGDARRRDGVGRHPDVRRLPAFDLRQGTRRGHGLRSDRAPAVRRRGRPVGT